MARDCRRRTRRMDLPCVRLLGVVLLAAGLVMLFACVPGWAWSILAGAALVALGLWLVTLGLK